MAGVNKVIILGRLGQDPELKTTQSGQMVCTLNLATSESWVKDGQKEEKTEWHRVVLWAKQAELASKYLKKGRNVYIEGRLQTRSWEDAQGQKRFTTEIVGNTLTFVDSGNSAGASRQDDAPSYGDQDHGGGGYSQSNNNNSFSNSGRGSFKPVDVVASDDDVPF